MPGSRLYNFTLKQPQFEITPFQAVAFEPKDKVNVGLLSESLNKIEERRKSFDEKKAGLIKMFGDVNDKLVLEGPGSEEQVNWWNNFQNAYNTKLEEWSNSGDLAGALEAATEYSAEAYANKELHARMKASDDYRNYTKDIEQRVKEGKVSNRKYKWWKNSWRGQYSFNSLNEENSDNAILDNEGNIIYSGTPYMETLYDDFNPMLFGLSVEKLINPDSKTEAVSRASERAYHKDGSGSSTSSSTSTEHSETEITQEEILELERAVQNYFPDLHAQVAQQKAFEEETYLELQSISQANIYPDAVLDETGQVTINSKGEYLAQNEDGTTEYRSPSANEADTDLLERLGKTILSNNGTFLTSKEYYDKNVFNVAIAAALAYKNTVNRKSSSSGKSVTKASHGGGGGGGNAAGYTNGNNSQARYVPAYNSIGVIIGKRDTQTGEIIIDNFRN